MKQLFSTALALLLASFTGIAQCEADHVVEASSFEYSPSAITIEQGESVAFVNLGGTHDVNGDVDSQTGMSFGNPESFYIGAVTGTPEGECIGTYTFNVPGTYNYDCSIGNHAAQGMVASIVVNPAPMTPSVVDIIVNSEDHTTLETAVVAADLVETLSGAGPFTVFAPTDSAFDNLPEGTLDVVLADNDLLTSILTYHVVGSTALSTDLSDGMTVTTLNGADVTVTINDEGVFINDAQVTVVDIMADNGVVHVIDAVLLPPAPPATTVVDVIAGSPDHELLEAAVGAAGLVDFLSAEGPFTVFAPTDAAVTALVEALEITAEELLALEDLGDILKYHVVAGEAMSTDLVDGQMIATLLGSDVTVTINDEGVFINNAQVTVVDIEADNGVVHVLSLIHI